MRKWGWVMPPESGGHDRRCRLPSPYTIARMLSGAFRPGFGFVCKRGLGAALLY